MIMLCILCEDRVLDVLDCLTMFCQGWYTEKMWKICQDNHCKTLNIYTYIDGEIEESGLVG